MERTIKRVSERETLPVVVILRYKNEYTDERKVATERGGHIII